MDEQAKCNPDMPIPLHYEPIRLSDSSPNQSSEDESHDVKAANQNASAKIQKVTSSNHGEKEALPDGQKRNRRSPENMGAKQVSLLKSTMPKNSWHVLSKTLLLRKAATVYYSLADQAIKDQKHGTALKNLRISMYCFSECLVYNNYLLSEYIETIAYYIMAS